MNPADEEAAKIEPTELKIARAVVAPAVASSNDKLYEQLRHELLSVLGERLDHESSKQKAIYDRLVAIETQTKRRGSRGFVRFLLAICIGVAATLAWQSYGDAAKQVIATLETPQTASVVQTATENVAPKAPAALSLDPEQMQQLTRSLTTLQKTVEQLAAGQDRMAREMARLEADLVDIFVKVRERQ